MKKCDKCGEELYEKGDIYEDEIVEEDDLMIETFEGELICNECDCERLHEENFVETDYKALNEIAKGRIPAGYRRY